MAKSKPRRRPRRKAAAPKRSSRSRSGKRPTARAKARPARKRARKRPVPRAREAAAVKRPRLDRARRTLDETLPTPPSSLNLERKGSAARTGRTGLHEDIRRHTGMTPALTGGDVDADWENAYFSGDEAPGGDNPTPDQEVVEEIGKSLGVEYQDSEELRAGDKLIERDKHRWELDPASSEDYKDR